MLSLSQGPPKSPCLPLKVSPGLRQQHLKSFTPMLLDAPRSPSGRHHDPIGVLLAPKKVHPVHQTVATIGGPSMLSIAWIKGLLSSASFRWTRLKHRVFILHRPYCPKQTLAEPMTQQVLRMISCQKQCSHFDVLPSQQASISGTESTGTVLHFTVPTTTHCCPDKSTGMDHRPWHTLSIPAAMSRDLRGTSRGKTCRACP